MSIIIINTPEQYYSSSYFFTAFCLSSHGSSILRQSGAVWRYTAGRPPLSKLPKQLMAIRSSSGFSHLRSGEFHISLRTRKTQHTQPRRWKKREQTWTWVCYKCKKEEVCDSFVPLSVHLQAITSVYSSEIPTKSPGMLTHLLTLANLASGSTHPTSRLSPTSVDCSLLSNSVFCPLLLTVGFPWLLSTALFCWLVCFVSLSWLIPSLDSGTFLPSSSPGHEGNITCKPFVGFSRQNRQRNLLTGTHPHPQKWMPLIVSQQRVLKIYMINNLC